MSVLTYETKMGTIVTIMGTVCGSERLSTVLFGKTRKVILSLLYGNADQSFYQREIVRRTGVGMGAAQREVKQLSDSGIIKRTVRGNQVYYQADSSCPIFKELKNLLIKTVGVADVLKIALEPLSGRIKMAFIYGSIVRGDERSGSDVDIMVVGDVTFAEISSELSDAQKELSREINPSVYPVKEFRAKIAKKHHFLKTVINQDKIFLIGDDDVLEKLVE
jgi:uncharacterized protein